MTGKSVDLTQLASLIAQHIGQPTYGLSGACAYLNTSETTLRALIDSGELAASKPGREYVIRKVVLDAYLERLEREQTEARKAAYEQGLRAQVPTAVSKVRGRRGRQVKLSDLPPLP